VHTFLRVACLLGTVLFCCPSRAEVLTFEDFSISDAFGPSSFESFSEVNAGSLVYGGVTWNNNWWLAGDEFVARQDHSDMFQSDAQAPFLKPQSGRFAVFNAFGETGLLIETPLYLTGVWLARPTLAEGPDGATQVTVSALAGTTVLGSVSLDLAGTTPLFMNTSSFLGLSGITGYRFDRQPGPGEVSTHRGFFIADDFQFVVPEPSTVVSVFIVLAGAMTIAWRQRAARSW
jgi:hypothetical protein